MAQYSKAQRKRLVAAEIARRTQAAVRAEPFRMPEYRPRVSFGQRLLNSVLLVQSVIGFFLLLALTAAVMVVIWH